MYNALLFARALTTRISYVPGAASLLEPVRRWGQKCEGSVVVNDFDGDLKFELTLSDAADSRIFWYGSRAHPVMALLDRLVGVGQTVVDVGAGAGEITLFAAKRVGEARGRVVAVEADEEHADRLTRNLALNRFDHVDVLRMTIGDRTSASDDEDATSTLDALLDEGWFAQLDLLKLSRVDLGVPVLQGARQVLDAFTPWIVLQGGGPGAADVARVLSEHEYSFFKVDRESHLHRFDGRPPFPWAVACPPGKTPG